MPMSGIVICSTCVAVIFGAGNQLTGQKYKQLTFRSRKFGDIDNETSDCSTKVFQ
jgi:hypothetical protein